jgi:hypothetical protein
MRATWQRTTSKNFSHHLFEAALASAQIRFANDISFANAKGRRQSNAVATAAIANLSAGRRGLG